MLNVYFQLYIGTTSVKENYFCVWPDRQLFYLTRLVSVSESLALRFDEGLSPFRKSFTKACHIIILIYVELTLAKHCCKESDIMLDLLLHFERPPLEEASNPRDGGFMQQDVGQVRRLPFCFIASESNKLIPRQRFLVSRDNRARRSLIYSGPSIRDYRPRQWSLLAKHLLQHRRQLIDHLPTSPPSPSHIPMAFAYTDSISLPS